MDGTIKVGDLGLVKDMMTEGNHEWNNEGMQSVSFVTPQSPVKNHTNQIERILRIDVYKSIQKYCRIFQILKR